MRNIFIVSWFTILETLRKKSFIISNILIIAMILIIFTILQFQLGNYVLFPEETSSENANTLSADTTSKNTNTLALDTTSGEDSLDNESSEKTSSEVISLVPVIAIVDSENLFGSYLENVNSGKFDIDLKPASTTIEELKDLIKNEDIYSAIYINSKDNTPNFTYIAYEYSSTNSKYADELAELLKNTYETKVLTEANVPVEIINKVQTNVDYKIELAKSTEDISDSSVTIGLIVSFLLFFSIYLFGHNISASIASEKNSKVIETLTTSTSPSNIVIGKTLGTGILGLVQLIVICLVTFVCYKTFIPAGIDIVGLFLSNVNISVKTILLLFVYFILGFTLYAFLNAITGATVSRPEDIQIANLPVSFITMISFYLSFFSITLGTENKLSAFTSILPFSSPFFMPSRIIANLATTDEILASIGILIVTTIILSFISIKIYSVAILHYGNRLKFKDLFKIFFLK